jgi:hypothetical protein
VQEKMQVIKNPEVGHSSKIDEAEKRNRTTTTAEDGDL